MSYTKTSQIWPSGYSLLTPDLQRVSNKEGKGGWTMPGRFSVIIMFVFFSYIVTVNIQLKGYLCILVFVANWQGFHF